MALIEFKNLPDTSTPITAENLNNNFNELNNTLQNYKGNNYSNVDLDDFTTTGIYYMQTGLQHAPTAGYGYMLVMNNSGPDVAQFYIDVASHKSYIRTRVTSLGVSSWTGWSTLEGDIYLGSNPDIDSLKRAGTYGIYGCTQTPTTQIGVLEVLVYTGDWILQRFNDIPNHHMYERYFESGTTWTNWTQRW